MLTHVDVVQGDGSDTLVRSLPILGATPKSSLLVQKITGLNPPDADLFIGDYARDGGSYQGRRVSKRNPVLTLQLNPNPALGETVSSLREELYKAFMDPLVDADFIKLNFVDDLGAVRYLVGYTEKLETDIFDVETMAQVSVICPDPYLRDNEETVLSDVSGWTTVPFVYTGTAETGFVAKIYIVSATSTLTLENNGKKMIFNRSFAAGDIIWVSTIRGDLYCRVTSGSVTSSILSYMTPTSPWLQLHSQTNTMKVYGATTSDAIAAIRELRYTQAYWGI